MGTGTSVDIFNVAATDLTHNIYDHSNSCAEGLKTVYHRFLFLSKRIKIDLLHRVTKFLSLIIIIAFISNPWVILLCVGTIFGILIQRLRDNTT